MKALFWNIGKRLTSKKLGLVREAIASELPDIFCIAEGSTSKDDCQKIINVFESFDYTCYYSPLFYENEALNLNYKWVPQGLKIFVKSSTIPIESFSFSSQRESGRIVVLKTYANFRSLTIIFLHNLSKSGNRSVTLDQSSFINSLREMINVGKIADDTDRAIIMGDFNLEPWEEILRNKRYMTTTFFHKHNSFEQRKINSEKQFFNPIAEYIFQSNVDNLGGTFYSEADGWALFDYVLYNTLDSNISYDIVTSFENGSTLLDIDPQIHKKFLLNELDHLPIVAKINN